MRAPAAIAVLRQARHLSSRRSVNPMVVGEQTTLRVHERPANVTELTRHLAALRERYAGAIFERYLHKVPTVASDALVCAGAAVIGDVTLGAGSSVWYNAVLRGDMNRIVVGAHSNIQDGTIVHLGDQDPTIIGEHVVVGHRAVLHGCTLEDHCLIGMQATVLDGAVIGRGSIVGAGAIVSAGTVIPPLSLVLGVPAKVKKSLDPGKEEHHRLLAEKYARLAYNYRCG